MGVWGVIGVQRGKEGRSGEKDVRREEGEEGDWEGRRGAGEWGVRRGE